MARKSFGLLKPEIEEDSDGNLFDVNGDLKSQSKSSEKSREHEELFDYSMEESEKSKEDH